jgi:hypothetical protein
MDRLRARNAALDPNEEGDPETKKEIFIYGNVDFVGNPKIDATIRC